MNSAPADTQRFPTALLVFTLSYVVLASFASWLTDNREFVFYIVVMAVLIAALILLYRHVALSRPLLWCFSAWGLLHMAGGLMPVPATWPIDGGMRVLYSLWLIPGLLKYDQVVHFYGFGITTWLCWEALAFRLRRENGGRDPQPSAGVLLLCAAGGMGFGALNEVIEFIATLTVPETNVGGYENTGWDLVANLAGCATAALCLHWKLRKHATS